MAREVGAEGKLGVQAEVGNVGTYLAGNYVSRPLPEVIVKLILSVNASPRLCSNLSSGDGWRFHTIHHG